MNLLRLPLAAVIVTSAACSPACPSSTPTGVNVEPLTSLTLNPTSGLLDRISAHLNDGSVPRGDGAGRILIFQSPVSDPQGLVFRKISLYEYSTSWDASREFESYRVMFTRRSEDWALYKEAGRGADRYFLSYRTAHWNMNHGMPVGVIRTPDILLAVLKQRIFIVVTYEAFRQVPDFAKAMSDDIAYVSELLKKAER